MAGVYQDTCLRCITPVSRSRGHHLMVCCWIHLFAATSQLATPTPTVTKRQRLGTACATGVDGFTGKARRMEDMGKKEAEEPVAETVSTIVAVPKPMLSRPLYTNPVCLLTSRASDEERPNVMTITWVTAINNDGWFTMSVNQTRHTAAVLARSTEFGAWACFV